MAGAVSQQSSETQVPLAHTTARSDLSTVPSAQVGCVVRQAFVSSLNVSCTLPFADCGRSKSSVTRHNILLPQGSGP